MSSVDVKVVNCMTLLIAIMGDGERNLEQRLKWKSKTICAVHVVYMNKLYICILFS